MGSVYLDTSLGSLSGRRFRVYSLESDCFRDPLPPLTLARKTADPPCASLPVHQNGIITVTRPHKAVTLNEPCHT